MVTYVALEGALEDQLLSHDESVKAMIELEVTRGRGRRGEDRVENSRWSRSFGLAVSERRQGGLFRFSSRQRDFFSVGSIRALMALSGCEWGGPDDWRVDVPLVLPKSRQ